MFIQLETEGMLLRIRAAMKSRGRSGEPVGSHHVPRDEASARLATKFRMIVRLAKRSAHHAERNGYERAMYVRPRWDTGGDFFL